MCICTCVHTCVCIGFVRNAFLQRQRRVTALCVQRADTVLHPWLLQDLNHKPHFLTLKEQITHGTVSKEVTLGKKGIVNTCLGHKATMLTWSHKGPAKEITDLS